MDKKEFVKFTGELYYRAAKALETRERELLGRLDVISNDQEVQELRTEFYNIFHTQTQHHFNILSREFERLINNAQDNFLENYNNIVAMFVRFDQFVETRRDNLLLQYDAYHERYYPDAPVFMPKTAAIPSSSQTVQHQDSSSSNSISHVILNENEVYCYNELLRSPACAAIGSSPGMTRNSVVNYGKCYKSSDIDTVFNEVRERLNQEKVDLAKQVKAWIKSHYSTRQQDTWFSICIKHGFDLDKRLENSLSKLQDAARSGGVEQEVDDQLQAIVDFIRDARATIFTTLKQSPDQLHALNYAVDEPLDIGDWNSISVDDLWDMPELTSDAVNEIPPRINVTAPVEYDEGIVNLIRSLGEEFSHDLYTLLLLSGAMGDPSV